MTVEDDPIHVIGFAFMPVGGLPHPHHGGNPRRIVDPALDPQPPFQGDRVKVIDHLEARLLRIAVNPADIRKEIEAEFRILFKKPAQLYHDAGCRREGMHAVGMALMHHLPPEAFGDLSAVEGGTHGYLATADSEPPLLNTWDLWIFS